MTTSPLLLQQHPKVLELLYLASSHAKQAKLRNQLAKLINIREDEVINAPHTHHCHVICVAC